MRSGGLGEKIGSRVGSKTTDGYGFVYKLVRNNGHNHVILAASVFSDVTVFASSLHFDEPWPF